MARPVIGLALLLGALLAANLALRQGHHPNSLQYLRMAATHEAYTDSWEPMAHALTAWDEGRPVYQTVYFDERRQFLYPLSSLLVPMALRPFAHGDVAIARALNSLGLIATVLFALCTMTLVTRWNTWRDDGVLRHDATFLLGMFLVAGIEALNFPLQMNYLLGQAQTFVNLGLAAALVAWSANRPIAAGVAIGAACLVKPHLALFLLWGLARREWRFVAGLGATIAGGIVAALWVFGLAQNLAYWSVLSDVGQRGSALYANQSVNGLLNRLVLSPEYRHAHAGEFPPPHAVVLVGTVVTSLIFLGAAFVIPRRRRFSNGSLDFGIMALTATMAVPLAWDHNYAVLLPIVAVAAGSALDRRPVAAVALVILAGVILVTGTLWEPLLACDAPPGNVLQSYVLAGATLALVVMYQLGATAAPIQPAD